MQKQIDFNKKLLSILESRLIELKNSFDLANEKKLDHPDLWMPSIHAMVATLPKQISDMENDIKNLQELIKND